MIKKILFIAIILISFSKVTFSQTNAEMRSDAAIEYEKADKELNLVYTQLSSSLDLNQKQLLIESERAWIKYRDLECKFQAVGYTGGSMYPLIFSSCMTDLTKKRTQELKESLSQGD
jgi:uncharacterized protein YecT (DUF1311 family)